jgi:hypothetical protein
MRATKINKNQGVIFNDNCCQFLMSIIVNSGILFVFALMKCSYAAFGEQNKTDNDSKCQQVYKSLKNINYQLLTINYQLTMTTQDRFTLALHATWSILRDPVLTKIYSRLWKRYVNKSTKVLVPGTRLLTLYGYIFNAMYHEL